MRSGLVPRLAWVALAALAGCEPRATETRPPVTQLPRPPASSAATPALPEEPAPLGKLPEDVRPLHYDLSLEIQPERERYSGVVAIKIALDAPRDLVWMHAKGIHALEATVVPDDGAPIAAQLTEIDKGGVAALRLARPIEAGGATIRIAFDAAFGARSEGLYRMERGGARYAFTQFESIFARQTFPCFDEPGFKAPFDVQLFVPKGQAAIGNTTERERTPAQNGLERVVFATTPPLPTYLVAMAVGPFDVVTAPPVPPNDVRAKPLPLRAVVARGRGPELAYALAETPKMIASLERYFGIAFPFEKLDVIAVPEKGGAMENAGAITFDDGILLVDPDKSSLATRRAFAEVMSHELAHQWVGDLVTMRWWDDTWLNESFATWAATRRTAETYPELGIDAEALGRELNVMSQDALVSARQIRQPVRGNDDILNAFDGITYTKGGAVLSMFERWVGEKTFRDGLARYLDAHKYASGSSTDFLAAVSDAAKRDVATPMSTFLNQPGVPIVSAELRCEKGADAKPKLHLAQQRFFPLGSTGKTDQLWQIPICARAPSGPKGKETTRACTLLTAREGDLELPAGACPAWAHPNADGEGYYRFAMPGEQLKKLGEAVSALSERERMTYAGSLRAAFASGAAKGDDVLRAMVPLARDPSRHVADMPLAFVRGLDGWLEGDPLHEKLLELGRKIAAPWVKELGWEAKAGAKEPQDRKLFRATVLDFASAFAKDPAVRKEAARRGRAFLGLGGDGKLHREAVEPDLVEVALVAAVQDGEPSVFDAAFEKMSTTEDDSLRAPLFFALASSRRAEHVERLRAFVLGPRAATWDTAMLARVELADPVLRDGAWTWLKANLAPVFDRLPPARRARFLGIGGVFCDAAHLDEWTRVIEPVASRMEGGPRALATSRETIALCVERRKVQEASVRAYFGGAKGKLR